jgi:hypothetical protein
MFASSGFFVGNLQFTNFLTSAAFIPLCLRLFLQWQGDYNIRNTLLCAGSFYLLVTAGHPAIPIGMFYFILTFMLVRYFGTRKSQHPIKPLQLAGRSVVLLLVSCAFVLPLLYSFSEIIPFLNRRETVMQEYHITTGFTAPSYLSFIFPFATNVEHGIFGNTGLMRNGYFSLAGILFFGIALFQSKNSFQKSLLITGIIFLVLSLGGEIKRLLYSNLPLFQFIRTNGEYRVFSIIAFILLGSYPLNNLIISQHLRGLQSYLRYISWFAVFIMAFALILWYPFSMTLPFEFSSLPITTRGKWMLDNLPFSAKLMINAAIILIITTIALACSRMIKLPALLILFVLADTIAAAWINLPYSGVQTKSAAEMQALLKDSPDGIPVPAMTPLYANTRPDLLKVIGCWSYYSKQPGTPELCDYPTLFVSTESYFNSEEVSRINNRPFAFMERGTFPVTPLPDFSSSDMRFQCESDSTDNLVLLQNIYPGWKIYKDNQPVPMEKYLGNFMSVELEKGKHLVRFSFENGRLLAVVISWLVILGIAGGLFCSRKLRSVSPSSLSR